METAAFAILWLSLALYAVLAGADFGVGFWVLVSHASKRGGELRRDAFSYFSPLWEVNTLFLIFFLMGLFTAFAPAIALLGRALLPLVLAALLLFVVRSAMYALLHHGPVRWRAPATWVFGTASVGAGVLLGYAAAAPASGLIAGEELPARYYASAVGIASLPLALAASAHLAALVLASYAHLNERPSSEWFRVAAIGSGLVALAAATHFTLAVLGQAPHTGERLLGPHATPMLAAAASVAGGLAALGRRRYGVAALLTGFGYLLGLVGGAFAQLPFVVYPSLTLSEAASPTSSIAAFLLTTAIGGPLLIAAMVVLYATTLRPARPEKQDGRC